jgi:hypothetical protein
VSKAFFKSMKMASDCNLTFLELNTSCYNLTSKSWHE